MKTYSSDQIKAMKASMKTIRELLKGVEEDDVRMEAARNNYTYDNAMGRNRERFFDIMKELNEMAEQAAIIYNLHTVGDAKWMTAEASYKVENY